MPNRVPCDIPSPEERTAASGIPVRVVWWELPDKSWEAVCLSEQEADREEHLRREDAVIRSWGRVGRDQLSLLEWFEHRLRAAPDDLESHAGNLREVLRRVEDHEPGPVVIRTW